jgi:hypothetical protein
MAKQRQMERWLDALFAYRLPQQILVLIYKNGALVIRSEPEGAV